jgi:hypothetical protein
VLPKLGGNASGIEQPVSGELVRVLDDVKLCRSKKI